MQQVTFYDLGLSKQVLQRLKNGESNISDLEYKINNLIRGSLGI